MELIQSSWRILKKHGIITNLICCRAPVVYWLQVSFDKRKVVVWNPHGLAPPFLVLFTCFEDRLCSVYLHLRSALGPTAKCAWRDKKKLLSKSPGLSGFHWEHILSSVIKKCTSVLATHMESTTAQRKGKMLRRVDRSTHLLNNSACALFPKCPRTANWQPLQI